MEVKTFDFNFNYKGVQKNASCTVYSKMGEDLMPYKLPIYRVLTENHNSKPIIFLFYKQDQSGSNFFHYPFSEGREALGEAIQDTLVNLNL